MGGKGKIVARPYQLELLDAAIEENTIVVLGTGTGKTFISVLLIKEMQHQILGNYDTHKRTIFLVTTVSQQAGVVKDNLEVNVGEFRGDGKIDTWDQSMWLSKFQQHHVLVMTAQIFVNILAAGFVPLNKINLVIFDECHHATKEHPYAQVMRFFDAYAGPSEQPRVLGLTASLIHGKCRAADLEKRIRDLEKVLQCRAQTSQDLVAAHRFGTKPEECIVEFHSSGMDHGLAGVFTAPIQFLAAFHKHDKTPVYDFVKALLVDCNDVLEEIGPSALYKYSDRCLEDVKSKENSCFNATDRKLLSLCRTYLCVFQKLYSSRFKSDDFYVSAKVKRLLLCLEDFGINNGEADGKSNSVIQKDKLCGIIFVQQRSTALTLCEAIKHFAATKPHLHFIHCDYVVGHGSAQSYDGAIAKLADMTVARQQAVLSRFRSHKVNLLVSTSVVEEGVDVPHCNLVIRYSLPTDFRSYVQSRGRARASNSQYLMMVDAAHNRAFSNHLANLQEMEQMLESLCHGRHVPVVDDDDDDDDDQEAKNLDQLISPFLPYGEGTQIRATATSSLQLLNMYCQRLPSDDFYHPVPIYKISKVPKSTFLQDSMYGEVMREGDVQYQCTITLPISCPVIEPILGHPMDTPKLAKRDAAVQTIRQLYNAKELDEHLAPSVGGGLDYGFEEEDTELKEERKILDAGTNRRKQQYPVKGPQLLSECQPVEGVNYLYMIVKLSDERAQNIIEVQSYGIVTSQPLPSTVLEKNDITLYDGHEEVKITVRPLEETVSLTAKDLKLSRDFHRALFERVLNFEFAFLEFNLSNSPRSSYLVVPINLFISNDGTFAAIDYDLMESVVNPNPGVVWPCSPKKYENTLVSVIHRTDREPSDSGHHQLFRVTNVDNSRSPLSSFPDKQWSTFQEFYFSKYNYQFSDLDQPLLEVTYASSRLEYLTQRKLVATEETVRHKQELFPEICEVQPLLVDMYNFARLLPTILYRFESLLNAHELISEVDSGQYLGGYLEADSVQNPKCSLVLQALTLTSAQDCFNMERLELLGDTFLKMITTVSLHTTLPAIAPVGVLNKRRTEMFSNLHLYFLAKKKIPSKMKATLFKARSMWLPPGYSLTDGEVANAAGLHSQVLPDKRIADCVEALIGAYITAGGTSAGLKFLEWLGLKLKHSSYKSSPAKFSTPSQPFSPTLNALLDNSAFCKYFSSVSIERQPLSADEEKLFAGLKKLDGKFWKFNDKYLLLEAMTHVSYTYNRVTSCYQRLELLGDAILDYLVTSYLYTQFTDYDEGQLSLLRSALVSNTTLALLALMSNFHKAVKHASPKLFSKIQQFAVESTEVLRQFREHSFFAYEEEDFIQFQSDDMDGEDENDILDPPKVLADIVESLVGAVFIDSNKDLAAVWSAFQPLFQPFVEKFSKKLPVCPVRQLLETDAGGTTTFKKLKCADDEVECVVKVKGKGIVVSARASSYKAAKKAASKKALSQLPS